MNSNKKGFSIIFVAILLAVVGAITIQLTSITPSSNDIAAEKTRAMLKEIRQRLKAYKSPSLLEKSEYPCPSLLTANTGEEVVDCTTGLTVSGNVSIGGLPVITLGLPAYYAFDGWGNRFTYYKERDDALGITVTNIAGTTPLWSFDYSGLDMSTLAVAVVSHGTDGTGAHNRSGTISKACNAARSDGENCDSDNVLIYDKWNSTTGSEYDDLVMGRKAN